MAAIPGVDVIVVSPGSTRGLQIADRDLASMLEAIGASVLLQKIRVPRRRLGDPFDDLLESWATHRAVRSAVARLRPRCLIFSSPTSALLASPGSLPHAIWFDQPAPFHLHGVRNAVIRGLERRALDRATILLPYSQEAMHHVVATSVPVAVVPTPVTESRASPDGDREDLVTTYAAGPSDKGLDLICQAWSRTAMSSRTRLIVAGIQREDAQAFLARRGVELPDDRVQFAGMLPQPEFLELLTRTRIFLTASRSEGFGQAALQALDAGCALVGAPGSGPFPALTLARQLDPAYVVRDRSPEALAGALSRALSAERAAEIEYRNRAHQLLAPYRRPRILDTLRHDVLPLLLGQAGPGAAV